MSHPPITGDGKPAAASPATGFWSVGRLAWAIGLAAGSVVLLTLCDPGMTVDEPLDVRPGRTYLQTLRRQGWRFFDRDVVDRVFRDNAEHPPLGRWLLGIASVVGEPFEVLSLGPDPVGLYVRSGRLAPAVCLALLVGLVSLATGRRYGRGAGVAAGWSLAVMPRMFAHAHLGALDTFVALFWTWAFLRAGRALEARRPSVAMALAGVVWGLALLTKIHAWLLPPIVLAMALRRLGARGSFAPLCAWLISGLALYFLGWPWLWFDTWSRLWGYLSTGVVRVPIRVEYFGQIYIDKDVPWHYPWFYFTATVPVGLHILGAWGIVEAIKRRWTDAWPLWLAGVIMLVLGVFSTRVPVYDGERLFLLVFPLWAIVIGRGFAAAWERLAGRRPLQLLLSAALLAQVTGAWSMHPFGLSYYNALVGGLPGAQRMGAELTFWGDAVDDMLLRELARRAAPGDTACLAPTLAPEQGLVATSRALARRNIILLDESAAATADWVVVYRRTAYWKPEIRELCNTPPVFLRTRQGVWISGLWHRPRNSQKLDPPN